MLALTLQCWDSVLEASPPVIEWSGLVVLLLGLLQEMCYLNPETKSGEQHLTGRTNMFTNQVI